MPFNHAPSLRSAERHGLDLRLVEVAAAHFHSGHPYLLFHKPAISGIRKRANDNAVLMRRLDTSLREERSAPREEELRASIKCRSRRLIHTSFLAMITDGAKRTAALTAARRALSSFAIEASWKPRPVIKSFLDCAEIAVAVALAYDWLYDQLAEEERRIIEASLFRHVLEPAQTAYNDRFAVWPKRRDNCTLVSNSGILVASLAVMQRYREPAIELLTKSLASSWRIFDTLAPDGAWPEGLSYWSLAMRYASLMVAALESTLNQSFGLADRPGFAQTGDFALHAVGPFGAAFNFGDSELHFDVSSLAWFAHRYKRPNDGRLIADYDGWYLPFTTIWGVDRAETKRASAGPPTGKVFYSGDVACFRNNWSSDPAARPVYVAIKGGNMFRGGAASSSLAEQVVLHAQADAGSFIIDGARHRWVIDLGPDDYDLPGYFDHGADHRSGPRWQYYRTQTAGHNTLTIDGRNQLPNVRAPIIGERIAKHCKWVVFDLSAAYGKRAGSIRRGAALVERQVIIQDEVTPEVSGDITWAMHTSAQPVSVGGSIARFRLGEDSFVVRILEPLTACFEIASPPQPRAFRIANVRQLHGRSGSAAEGTRVSELPRRLDRGDERAAGALIRRLQIAWPKGARRLIVALLPDCDEDGLPLPVAPLSDWLAGRPIRLTQSRRADRSVVAIRPARGRSAIIAGAATEALPSGVGRPISASEMHAGAPV